MDRQKIYLLLILLSLAIIGTGAATALYFYNPDLFGNLLDQLEHLFGEAEVAAKEYPYALVGAIAVLPCIGAPVSAFFIIAAVHGTINGILLCILGVSLNLTLSYVLSKHIMRGLLEQLMNKLGFKVPQISRKHAPTFTFLFRAIPGPPFIVQNYLMGLANIPFLIYFPISLAVLTCWISGFVIMGKAIFSVSPMKLALAVAVLIAAAALINFIRIRLQKGEKSDID